MPAPNDPIPEGELSTWNAPTTPKKETFWAGGKKKPRKPAQPTDPSRPPMARWKRITLWSAGSVGVVLLLALLLAPTIAGWIAPGYITRGAAGSIAGPVRVEDMSLSWFGSQSVGSIVVIDPAKSSSEVVRLQIQASPGLLSLAMGAMGSGPDLGEIRVSGKGKIIRDADGATSLGRALAPSKSAAKKKPTPVSSKPAELPAGLQGRLVISDLDLTYTDDSTPAPGATPVGTVQIKGIKADARLIPADTSKGASATLKLSGKTISTQSGAPDGTFKIDATIDALTGASGALQIAKAKIDAEIRSEGLSVGVIDALAGMGGRLGAALGPSLDLAVDAKGSLKSAEADWKVTTQHTSVVGAVTVNDGVVGASSPILLKADGQVVRAFSDLDKTLAVTGTVAVSQVPSLTLSVDSLSLRLPVGGGGLDLRGSAAKVTLKTTETKGTVKLLAEPGAKPDEFNVTPLTLTIDAPDLAGPVKIQGSTVATLAGKPAGNLTIDLTGAGLLDAIGAPRKGLPSRVEGVVRLHNVATAIAQPFVKALKIDLPGDVGPTLNLDVKATTEAAPTAAGALPPVNIDLFVTGEKIDAKAGLTYADNVLRSRQQGVTVNLAGAGGMASRLVDPATGWSLGKTGKLALTVTDIAVPLKDGAPALDQAQAKVDLQLTGFSATPTTPKAAAGGPVDLTSLKIGATLAPGAAPKVTLDSSLVYQKRPFTGVGSFKVPGLYSVGKDGAPVVTPMNARPVGTLELKNIPANIAGVATSEPKPAPKPAPGQPVVPGAPGLDLARLVTDAVGPAVGVTVTSEASKSLAGGLDVGVVVRAERLTTDIKTSLNTQQAVLNSFTSSSTLVPATLDTLLAALAPGLTPRPRLTAPSKVVLRIDPLSIPLVQGADGSITPDLARTGDATVHLELPDQTLVSNLVLKNADGTSRDLGTLGVDAVDVKATVPLATALVPQARWLKPFAASVKARLLDAPNSRALTLAVVADGQLTGAQGTGTNVESAKAKITVSDIVPQRLERFVGKPGVLTGSLGESAALDANVVLRQVNAGTPQAGQAIDADALLKSPLVSMDQPLHVSVLPDRIKSDAPVKINWKMLPAFANAFVFVPPPPQPGKAAAPGARIESPVNVTVTLDKFVIATGREGGKAVGPLKAGIFDAAAGAVVPALELLMPDGSRVKVANVRAGLQTTAPLQPATPNAPSDVAFQVNIDEVTVALPGAAGPPPPAQRLAFTGTVSNLADGMGNLTADRAALTAVGDMPVIPTGLVDALSKQNGLLVDALGPVCSATIRAERFGIAGGTIDLAARSERASAAVKGGVEQKTFISSEPIRVSLSEISTELAKRLVKGLPFIGTIEKTAKDEPAVFTATGMKVPLDNDLSRLNGDILIDPGQAKFTTSEAFAGILGALHQKTMGTVGQKLEPLKVNIKSGVVTYERWTFPLGQFAIQTQGTVDLVRQTVDVLTYLPMGTLSDSAAGLFKSQPGAAGKNSPLTDSFMVPWRTRGAFGKTKTEPDFGLFAKDLVKGFKPEDVLKKGLGDLLKPKEEPPKK